MCCNAEVRGNRWLEEGDLHVSTRKILGTRTSSKLCEKGLEKCLGSKRHIRVVPIFKQAKYPALKSAVSLDQFSGVTYCGWLKGSDPFMVFHCVALSIKQGV